MNLAEYNNRHINKKKKKKRNELFLAYIANCFL